MSAQKVVVMTAVDCSWCLSCGIIRISSTFEDTRFKIFLIRYQSVHLCVHQKLIIALSAISEADFTRQKSVNLPEITHIFFVFLQITVESVSNKMAYNMKVRLKQICVIEFLCRKTIYIPLDIY